MAMARRSPMTSPIASPPSKPVRTPVRVMPICTAERKFSGFSASASALVARLLVAAICLRRLLREVISAISDMAKKPFISTKASTSSSSSMRADPAVATRVRQAEGWHGRVEAGGRFGMVVHRMRPGAQAAS